MHCTAWMSLPNFIKTSFLEVEMSINVGLCHCDMLTYNGIFAATVANTVIFNISASDVLIISIVTIIVVSIVVAIVFVFILVTLSSPLQPPI